MHLAQDFQQLFTVASLISMLTLTLLEIVLGIDNIIFISIVAGKLPKKDQPKARATGLMLALIMRIGLLFSISWIVGLKEPLLTAYGFEATGRDIILFCGGVFLLVKTTSEIYSKMEGVEENEIKVKRVSLNAIVLQIVFIDIIFSFDSILTAVGLVTNLLVMILAVIFAMMIMLSFSGKVSDFIDKYPSIKMLALAFLLMIGMLLILDACHIVVPKQFVYFSMAFSLFVEFLNIKMFKKKGGGAR
jgi:predicted tellurium resistance membrane protein TerC